ncbi:MAG: precorrin-6y C5,15-methyltransferase (decarboxylating) subunit CbiE [Cyanobacteria bacterium SID2]|nr:precorrin-6y C5,15-methyltransferase (decarboxylating) subunit CbiE [Cyanobacteria bacterium SID2]MBP0004768.1 precorrin-6y C5,15-methyltransferase (decarboxylating) subunit CbiE [Cyanobacteria bacterium SBC]
MNSGKNAQFSGKLHVIGIGLDGLPGLSDVARERLRQAEIVAGSRSQLDSIPEIQAETLIMGKDLEAWLQQIQTELQHRDVVVLASGDPLFFGIGRLLTERFSREILVFYPHVSSVQIAFHRLQIPWQSATVVSVHGREADELEMALKQGKTPIGVLTDGIRTPSSIARTIQTLHPPLNYRLWVCSHLDSEAEQVEAVTVEAAIDRSFPMPNVTVLEGISEPPKFATMPLLGIPDEAFATFDDRPGLITKQEIRVLTLAMLQLPSRGIVWDIGAGTGSISVEIGRLVPDSQVFAVEQKAAGVALVRRNCDRFGVKNITVISGVAPQVLVDLPDPDRIVLGGGGTKLAEILAVCVERLKLGGVLVANFATLEASATANQILRDAGWQVQMMQVNISRSAGIASATRFVPLNPVTVLQAVKPG